MAARAVAVRVEIAKRRVAHGEGMPLARTDAGFIDVRRRQLRSHYLLGIKALDDAVDDALGAEVFGTVDAEVELGEIRVLHHVLGQEILRTEADGAAVLIEDVHRRRADERRDEAVGWIVVALDRRPDLP